MLKLERNCQTPTADPKAKKNDLLCNSNVPKFPFLNQLFELLPRRVVIFSQLDVQFAIFTKGYGPVRVVPSISAPGEDMRLSHQWMRYKSRYSVPNLARDSSTAASTSSGACLSFQSFEVIQISLRGIPLVLMASPTSASFYIAKRHKFPFSNR